MIDYSKYINTDAREIKPSGIRKYFDIAAEMKDVISLGIGEPDFSTPWHIRQAGIASLEKGKTWYSPNRGFMELRNEISKWFFRKYGVEYQPEKQVLVTVGGSEAIDLCLRALINEGDEVLIPEPSYVSYVPLTQMAKGVPVVIETKAVNNFRLTKKELEEKITPKTKLLILPFPSNPTGAVMHREHLEEIAEVIGKHDIFVLSDELYSELTYGEAPHVTIASIEGMYERTVVINGFSKAFAMTGWRLGYTLGPTELISVMTKLHQYAISCAPSQAQYAAIEALRNGDADVENMREQYDIRRRLVVDSLNAMGLSCFEPKGAFYAFPSIASTGITSEEFCERLLYAEQVAVVPGSAFGESGNGFVRVSYSNSIKNITEAMRRMERFVNSLK